MGAAIRMNDGPCIPTSHSLDGGIQHCIDQLGIWMRSNGPADDQAIEAVDDRREIHLASWDLELGDIREPLFIRGAGLEVAIDKVFRCGTDFACPSSDHLAQFGSWISGVSASSLG